MSNLLSTWLRACLAFIALSLLFSTAYAAGPASLDVPVEGIAKAIDGDTLEIGGTRVRLEGIDAPELAQTCNRPEDNLWQCGEEARLVLTAAITDTIVACDTHGLDKYGRLLGVCFAEGDDLNSFMVLTGYARAFLKYSVAYAEIEAQARKSRAGLWRGESEAPWDFRHKDRPQAQLAPQGCAIKGNISRRGQIYHLPSMPWYGTVSIDPLRGERWFCSEGEAAAAGWRPAQSH